MRKCELCGGKARMYCESDQANLCWDCDEKVHCANFLVAKHSRNLLCHVCHSPTPWSGSGRKLTPTVSVCQGCVQFHAGKCDEEGDRESRRESGEEEEEEDDDVVDDDDGFESYDESESEDDDDEDGENQVVPWSYGSSSSSPPPPPAVTSSSEGEDSGAGGGAIVSKRGREHDQDLDSDSDSDDEIECSSAQPVPGGALCNDEATSSSSIRPLKQARVIGPDRLSGGVEDGNDVSRTESKSTSVIRSIQRLQNRMPTDIDDASKMIFGICKMSRD